MVAALVISLGLMAAPPALRLVQLVQGTPVGVIEARVEGGAFHYRVRHVFRDEARAFEATWPVDAEGRDEAGRLPELLALARRRPDGCLEVREERTGATERLCLEAQGTRARLDGAPLRLAYGPGGALRAVELLDAKGGVLSRFEVSDAAVRPGADPFHEGFSIGGAPGPRVVLTPGGPLSRARVQGVARPVEGSCLPAARAVAASLPGASVQVGVLVEGGRAWPHAWVRRADGVQLDPTRPDDEARAGHYLPFPEAAAGRWYLELASGARALAFAGR
ncbi:MAG: hypothetical protein INH41_04290 [Myxococcaceae bacterium]|nr:hypothetical protein [Myxococcaceae bacterium]MCA3011602.1 hypothetical protein [Myxococcaceae bacterium]